MSRPMHPVCMSNADLVGWREANAATKTSRAFSPCIDCTTDFADEMRDIGRCDGEPGGDGAEVRADAASERSHALWADHEWRSRQLERIAGVYADAERAALHRERVRASWTPQRRRELAERNRRRARGEAA